MRAHRWGWGLGGGAASGSDASKARTPPRESHATLCVQVPTHLWEPTLLTGGAAAVFSIALTAGLWFGGVKLWEKK